MLYSARKFFQGLTPAVQPVGQRYSVACPEGHRLSGMRTDGYQALRCPTCGEGIFVLPRSPLPDPGTAPEKAHRSRPVSSRSSMDVDEEPVKLRDPVKESVEDETDGTIEWVDTDDEGAVDLAPIPVGDPFESAQAEIAQQGIKSRRRHRVTASDEAVAEGRARPSRTRTARPPFDLAARVKAYWNPLIFVAVVLVVVGTVAVRIRKAWIAELPIIAERGRIEGLAALDAGKFDIAYQLLSEARRAVRTLGDDIQGASAIKQGADEAEVIARLVSDPLERLLDQASRSEPDDWKDQFNKLYKGRTIIIEAEVTAVPDSKGEGRYDINYRILPSGEGQKPRSLGKIDVSDFIYFETVKPRLHDIVIFGATLASFTFDTTDQIWLVGLESDSGVIMTHHKALEALGWEPLETPAVGGDL